jgi:hypothetical protein
MVLDALLQNWLTESQEEDDEIISFAITTAMGLPRQYWKPKLDEHEKSRLASGLRERDGNLEAQMFRYRALAAMVIAFHSGEIIDDAEIARHLQEIEHFSSREKAEALFDQLKLTSKQRRQFRITPHGVPRLRSKQT